MVRDFAELRLRRYVTYIIYKMKNGFQLYCLTAMIAGLGAVSTACNSDDTWETEPQILSGTEVTAFSLKANSRVLANLDSVYFSINLVEGKIFNANPLPYGTDIDSLAVSISADACLVAELYVTRGGEKNDTVINYLTSPDEFVDFSYGPVRLHLVSADGLNERNYQISVNVSPEVADSLYWDELQKGALKGVAGMTRTKTVKVGDKAVTLSANASGKYGISTFVPAATAGGGSWEQNVVEPRLTTDSPDVNTFAIGSEILVETFTATEEGFLYLLDNNGNLYISTNGGEKFALCDTGWETITAPYLDSVLGVKNNAGSRSFASYSPHTSLKIIGPCDQAFPLNGASGCATFSSEWADGPQVVVAGGLTAAGATTGATWAYDGKKWARISDRLPAGSGYAMAKYTIAETDTINWRVKNREVLIAFGGINGADPLRQVWISRDMGVNWQKGSSLLQLPKYMPYANASSLLVFDKTLKVSPALRAVKPIEEWECPYLYLFGGYGVDGTLVNEYWSGVVNHLTFKPLQ